MVNALKHVIIGGGIAGTTAAEEIRKRNARDEITIISQEDFVLYNRIILKNFVEGTVPEERVYIKAKEWYENNRIILLKGIEAVGVDTERKIVKLSNSTELEYDKLLIASGSFPRTPEVRGWGAKGATPFHTIQQARFILSEMKKAKNVVVVGGGFIGLELADLLKKNNVKLTMLIREKYFWDLFIEEEGAELIHEEYRNNGIDLRVGTLVTELLEDSNHNLTAVRTDKGEEISCELACFGIGTTPATSFLKGSGVEVNKGVVVDAGMRTNVQDVFAAGDVAEFWDKMLDRRLVVGNWANALGQARVAAANMCREKQEYANLTAYSMAFLNLPLSVMADGYVRNAERVSRKGDGKYASFALDEKTGRMVGAILLNYLELRDGVIQLIKSKKDLRNEKEKLSNPEVELREL